MEDVELPALCCTLCRKNLTAGIGLIDGEAICSDCKFLLFEDASFIQASRIATRQINTNSSESIESRFNSYEHSDIEIDHIGNVESVSSLSLYGVSDVGSFSAYSGGSEASLGRHSFISTEFLGRAEEDFSDSDMDPMETGFDHWIYADGDDVDEMEDSSQYLTDLIGLIPESESSGQGVAPAAISFVDNMPSVIICQEHLINGSLTCVICKEALTVGDKVTQLPCLHVYHLPCIRPWLRTRNSCPLCRYDLPTHDKDYKAYTSEGSHSEGANLRRWCFCTATASIVTFVGIMLMVWLKKPVCGVHNDSRGQQRKWRHLF